MSHKWDNFPNMEQTDLVNESIECRIAQRIRSLRTERQWPLEELAGRSGVSRASLSRIENGEVSPTASVLCKICGAFGLTLSRLMVLVEEGFAPLVAARRPGRLDRSRNGLPAPRRLAAGAGPLRRSRRLAR